MFKKIPERWKELSGQNNWKNLLDPLDLDLRRYIIHYGERASATYDTFNDQVKSKYAGDSRYGMKDLFSKVGLSIANPFKYTATKYLYATSSIKVGECFLLRSLSREAWNKESNWMGYVAVATDEGKVALGRRDILIAWRGTIQILEWASDFNFPLTPATKILGDTDSNADAAADAAGDDADNIIPKVHSGFLSVYTSDDPRSEFNKSSARDQVLTEVQRLVDQYKDEEISITITGHSLGASLASLSAVDIAWNGYNKPCVIQSQQPCPVTAFAFASPRVGNLKFCNIANSIPSLRLLRITNLPDIVPKVPVAGYYSDLGQELLINNQLSKYMKYPGNTSSWHAVEGYLHGVAGTQGKKGGFKLEVKRDVALVNKHHTFLRDEYLVPDSWWVMKNKGMVQNEDGSWQLEDHEKDDDSSDDES
ncbi:phospholipase A1-II 1-like [Syzygium oleosum]|uniref:phospholipase A1-II 1-like n=1 Tax=Syzygium oleosum TaxID=219896 RepID=UPI0011D24587|nr:phospholipase A1-II 1-like [Syzygium oleosum]